MQEDTVAERSGPLPAPSTPKVLYILLAGWFFARIYRYAVRTGLLARYSAETAS